MWIRRGLPCRRVRSESGGAISLWVVLMVPVAAFAAVAAMAGPQRLAARSGMQDAADDLAAFTVAWRDGYQQEHGALPAFPMDCDRRSEAHQQVLAALKQSVVDEGGSIDNPPESTDLWFDEYVAWESRNREIAKWNETCTMLFDAMLRDLGRLGITSHALDGFYSDALETSEMGRLQLPCRTTEQVVVRDAVHVALAADWRDASWAAAQVWPDGFRVAAESMSRFSQLDTASDLDPCQSEYLEILDDQGRPVWANDPAANARQLSQSVRRTPLGG